MSITEQLNNNWSNESKRIILSPSLFSKCTLIYAQELGDFSTFPTYFAARSNLESYLIALTKSGKGKLEFNGESTIVSKGDLFFIDCMKPHKYSCASEKWDFSWIHINGVTVNGFYSQFVKNNMTNILHLSDMSEIENIFDELIKINETPSQINEIKSSKLINDLLTELLLMNFKSYRMEEKLPDFLREILSDIDKNFADPLRLDELAEKHNVNMYHLSKEFKRYLGINFKTYLLNRRITKAKNLLRLSNNSVSEIAVAVGFDSTSHFIEIFKKNENMTPLSYRNTWKNK